MPVTWNQIEKAPAQTGAFFHSGKSPIASVLLRPNRSLPQAGFAWMLLVAWAFLMLPMLPLLGTKALWILLPFMLAVLAALWISIHRSNHDGRMSEELTLWSDLIKVHRSNPRGTDQDWQASTYEVSLSIQAEGGPVEHYITLKGAGRIIELGAFLSPDERVQLYDDLQLALAKAMTHK